MQNTAQIKRVVVAAFLFGFVFLSVLPTLVYAQNTVRYGHNVGNNAVYLIPNGRSASDYGQGSLATNVAVSCFPTRSNARVGETITWIASVTGGNGAYYYTWNGTDGFSSNSAAPSIMYSGNGEKFASVTVTSSNQMVTVSCGSVRIGLYTGEGQTQVGQSNFSLSNFAASCYAVPERVVLGESATWLAVVTGVTASTTYAWDGADGLTGDRPLVSKLYTNVGVKPALLTVTNGSMRIVAACTNSVSVTSKASYIAQKSLGVVAATVSTSTPVTTLQGVCVPSDTSVSSGETVIWQAAVIGGNGTYEYVWSGDESLLAQTATTSKAYETAGTKSASVAVASGDKTVTLTCPAVEVKRSAFGLMASAFTSFVSGPFLLILGVILAIIIGIIFARRKKKQEEKVEVEKDHVE